MTLQAHPGDKSLPGERGAVAPDLAARPSPRIHAVLLAVQVAFGSLAVEAKVAMGPGYAVSPDALAMLRISGAALVFVVAHLAVRSPRVRSLGDMARLAGLALCGVVLNQVLFLSGLKRTSPVAATLLVATIPIFAALVGTVFRRDRITRRSALGISIAVVGIAVLSRFAVPRAGDALVLANSLSYAFYVVFAKDLLRRYGAVTVMAWVFALGAVLFAPLGAVSLWTQAPGWSAGARGYAAYIVLVPTILAYGASAWALERATPTLVAVYVYLQPLVVVTLAWAQLGEPLTPHVAGGGLLILAGVGVVATTSRSAAPRRAPADGQAAASPAQ